MNKLLSVIAVLIAFTASSVSAQVAVKVPSGEDCSWGKVAGLKSSGDGFLSVRTGPGSGYSRLDKIYNGQDVYMCSYKNGWHGIIYTKKGTDCQLYNYEGRSYGGRCWKGWAHEKWIKLLAG